GRAPVEIDARDAEGRYLLEPQDRLTPEALYQRRWALMLLDQAVDRVGQGYRRAGKGDLFDLLRGCLCGDADAPTYARIAGEAGAREAAVKKAAQRLRERFGAVMRELVADTVAGPGQVEEEVQDLFLALGR